MIGLKSSTAFIWQLQSLSVVGVVLELKHIMETNPIRASHTALIVNSL